MCASDPAVCNPYYLSVEDVAVMQENAPFFETVGRSFFLLNTITSLAFIIVSLIIAVRKSDDWLALLISAILISLGAVGIAPALTDPALREGWFYAVLNLIAFIGYFGPISALFYFPDGQFVPRWTRWFCAIFIFGALVFFIFSNYEPMSDIVWTVFGLFTAVCVLVGIIAMVYRYRRVATPLQKQQIKWVVVGLLLAALSVLVWNLYAIFLPTYRPNPTRTVLVALTFPLVTILNMVFPISVAVAMVRYRLWDIDVLIRRTVTYALLTGALLFVFFGSVILLQQLFSTLTGAGQSELVTVLSTLAIAALFVPLRNRIQGWIDRRFNRNKYDAQKILTQFAETVRDETDLERVSARLIEVVDETMQPKTISVWLKQD